MRVSCFLSFTAAEAIWRERLVRVKFFLGNCFVALQVSHMMSHDPCATYTIPICTSPTPTHLTVPHPLIPPAIPTTLSKCSCSLIPSYEEKQPGEPSQIFFLFWYIAHAFVTVSPSNVLKTYHILSSKRYGYSRYCCKGSAIIHSYNLIGAYHFWRISPQN